MQSQKRKIEDENLDFDLREYIDVFQVSSDRARKMLYIVLVATALAFIANYNIQGWSFPVNRLQTYFGYPITPEERDEAVANGDAIEIPKELFRGDPRRLKIAREEYAKQFISRYIMTSSPIPGISIDVNDLGVIGGISLISLMLILVLCIMRLHENLYLALYKIRQLCESDENHSHGDSRANLLYHALAMREVIISPPTLATWDAGWIWLKGPLGIITLLLPPVCYLWIVRGNLLTAEKGRIYRANIDSLLDVHRVFLGIILFLSASAIVVSISMTKRWRSAFFRINPARRYVKPMPWYKWLGLRHIKGEERKQEGLITRIVDMLEIAEAPREYRTECVSIAEAIDIPISKFRKRKSRVKKQHFNSMIEKLFRIGKKEAGEWCLKNNVTLVKNGNMRFRPTRCNLDTSAAAKHTLRVAGDFEFMTEVDSRKTATQGP